MKVYIRTFGCKVNQYESQVMLDMLKKAGFPAAATQESSDIIIINSCTVTATSDAKVRRALHVSRRKNPNAVIVLTGCMPQAFPDIVSKFEEADIILGTQNRFALTAHIMQYLSSRQQIIDISPHKKDAAFEAMSINTFCEHTRAYIKIEDGCNRFCSFCIIPYARGRVRSKPTEDIKKEAAEIAKNGFKEIVLTGINLSAYGQDIGQHLWDAIDAVCQNPSISRVRLGSLEPERLSAEVIKKLALQKKFCPQFHLALQSGCTKTLARMNRQYTAQDYKEIVKNLRSSFPSCAITTDIMVGFPGETPEEFSQSLSFVKEMKFARAHVFAYSRRPGTKAFDAPNQISSREKELRSREMINATQKSQQEFFKAQTGKFEEVLLEQQQKDGSYIGYSMNYTPISVKYNGDKNLAGHIIPVEIISYDQNGCHAVIL